MTRYIETELSEAITSNKRDPRPAIIPPFSFVGSLKVGFSGYWYPTSTMELTRCSLSASEVGTSTADISLFRREPFGTTANIEIARMQLSAEQIKTVKPLDRIVVTPYDRIFVYSWERSAHKGVVIQIIGNLMT